MKMTCPFINVYGRKVLCPYLIEANQCDDIAINICHDDAWCNKMIDRGMRLCESFPELKDI